MYEAGCDIPHHTTQCLSHDVSQIVRQRTSSNSLVELVRIDSSIFDRVVEQLFVENTLILVRRVGSHLESNDYTSTFTRYTVENVVCSSFRTGLVRVDELSTTVTADRSRWGSNNVLFFFSSIAVLIDLLVSLLVCNGFFVVWDTRAWESR